MFLAAALLRYRCSALEGESVGLSLFKSNVITGEVFALQRTLVDIRCNLEWNIKYSLK